MVIEANLRGQLGNQLFVYFAGAYLATKTGHPLRLNCNFFQGQDGRLALLDFELPMTFTLSGATPNRSRYLGVNRTQILMRALNRSSRLIRKFKLIRPNHPGFEDLGEIFAEKRTVLLDGYFQTFRYAETLRRGDIGGFDNRLQLKVKPDWFEEAQNVVAGSASLTVHVRLGDYLGGPRALDYGRFLSSLWRMKQLGDRFDRVTLFSDDFALASSLIREVLPVPIIKAPHPMEAQPSEVMVLMSTAKSLVISNSSFSWWSAYMSEARDIYAPWPWMQPGVRNASWNSEDLFPRHWQAYPSIFRG